jgi:hypothetical protein
LVRREYDLKFDFGRKAKPVSGPVLQAVYDSCCSFPCFAILIRHGQSLCQVYGCKFSCRSIVSTTKCLYSLIEANLVIITGCLPAMRRFLRHVAPQLMGESSSRSRGRSHKRSSVQDTVSTQPTQLQTIGSKATKKSYKRMEDDHVSISSDGMTAAGWHGEQDYERQVTAGAAWQGDQDSGHGTVVPAELGQIVKTESFVIRSDVRDSHVRDGSNWNGGL